MDYAQKLAQNEAMEVETIMDRAIAHVRNSTRYRKQDQECIMKLLDLSKDPEMCSSFYRDTDDIFITLSWSVHPEPKVVYGMWLRFCPGDGYADVAYNRLDF